MENTNARMRWVGSSGYKNEIIDEIVIVEKGMIFLWGQKYINLDGIG